MKAWFRYLVRPVAVALLFVVALPCITSLVQECRSFRLQIGKGADVSSTKHQRSDRWSLPRGLMEPPALDLSDDITSHRRRFLGGLVSAVVTTVTPRAAVARYVLDEETGDYVEVDDVDWQTAWKQRMDKASSMSKDEIFQAARGAGNLDLRSGPESDASKKRRAMSACRDVTIRGKAGVGSEKECTARVFAGDVDFILDSL